MRPLNTNDIFKMSRIIRKLNLKAEDIDFSADGENADQKMALALLLRGAENLELAQNEINDFIGNLVGMSGEEFGKLPLEETWKYLKEFQGLSGVASFFEHVKVWMKSQQ